MESASILRGMDVVDRTGTKIGLVAALYARPAEDLGELDAGIPSVDLTDDPLLVHSYVKVQQGGILGVGCHNLYIPVTSVIDIIPGQALAVDCLEPECRTLFGARPEGLTQRQN